MSHRSFCFAMLALGACGRAGDHQPSSPQPRRGAVSNEVRPILPLPGTGPDARTPFAPVRPTVDPKSNEAAEQLVPAFAKLVNERRFDEAYMLLGPNAPPRKAFDDDFASMSHLRVAAERPGEQEGAAGSIYLSVPLTITGIADGERVNRSATAIVRRVNNVPGSTEAQRRWHIERIDWATAG